MRRLLGFNNETDFPDIMTSWSDRLHPDDAEPTISHYIAHLADHSGRTPFDFSYRLKTNDGSYRWFRGTCGTLRGPNGEPLRSYGSVVDIHAQKVAEEAQALASQAQAKTVAQLATALKQLANQNLTFRLNEEFPEDYELLRLDFNSAIGNLEEVVSAVNSTAASIYSGILTMSAASDNLASRTGQQAASLEETAATLSEITSTIKKSADGAAHARQVVSNADKDARNSATIVNQAVGTMQNIASSAQTINQIIVVMDEIAFQTNLLALNAGVEAARAGDAGRGFAVVASEVRALAQRSAEAAKEIKGILSTSTTQVELGVKLVAETGTSLERISVQVAEVNGIMSEIAIGPKAQATSMNEINSAVTQMDQTTQQNANMVQESTESYHNLSKEVDLLSNLISRFKIGLDVASRNPENTREQSDSLMFRSPPKSLPGSRPLAPRQLSARAVV
ncbi:MAG: hypothetical protein B7Z76_03825 [Acidiphilium sp. 20-67-58]|nr:MAG: hypothetical protein B7Z76_03825 [Acidiphilium sp. 20-67-58]